MRLVLVLLFLAWGGEPSFAHGRPVAGSPAASLRVADPASRLEASRSTDWVPEHVRRGLSDCRRELAAGRFLAARNHATVAELWGARSGDLQVLAHARLLAGLALAAVGEGEQARQSLRPALEELSAARFGVDTDEWIEGRLTLMRLDWTAGSDDAALAEWTELRPELEGAPAVAADLFLSEACLQAAMPEAARVHARRALSTWRAAVRGEIGAFDSWCRTTRCLGWAGSTASRVDCRELAGVLGHLILARSEHLAGDADASRAAEARARELWPGDDFERDRGLLPARLRLALARDDRGAVEALIAAAEALEDSPAPQTDDLREAWRLDWNASVAPFVAAQVGAEVGVAEASWTDALDASAPPPQLLERRERLRRWLDRMAPQWMPLPLASLGPAPAAGLLWIPLWVRALGLLGGLGLGALGGVSLLQSRRSRRLEQRLSELERARESLVREAAAMSHDLKSPVLTMRCALDLLGLDSGDPAIAAQVAPVEQSMDHILRLADRSMELHMLRTTSSEVRPEPLEMVAFTRSVVERWLPLASEKRIALRFDEPPEGPGGVPWRLPRDRAERLLDNLLSNALKYSHPGSLVQVRVSEQRRGGRREGVLTVRDTGVGLDDSELPRFFEPLSRLSSEPTDGEPSTGLGTAIVEAIAKRYGGEAEVATGRGDDDAEHRGLRVTVHWQLR